MRLKVASLAAVATAVSVIVTLTLTTGPGATPVEATSAWGRVSCLTCSPTWLADIIGNVLLFVPFGAGLVAAGVAPLPAVLIGAASSLLIEALQYAGMPAGRTPALADLVSNTLGTALGAMLAWRWAALVAPPPRLARSLAAAWTAACAMMLAASAVALSPATPAQRATTPVRSALPFTPGYGWYAAGIQHPTVNGTQFTQGGTGPILVAMPRADSAVAIVRVHGRDARSDIVPIVYVHDPAMTTVDPRRTRAHLLLAQRGTAMLVTSDVRGARWGLAAPALELGAPALPPAGQDVLLRATVTSREWMLESRLADLTHASIDTVHQALSPAIGWVLVQALLPLRSPSAPLVAAAWLLAWFAPLGFWLQRAQPRAPLLTILATLGAVGALLGVSWLAAHGTGTAPLSPRHSAWCGVSGVIGAVLGALTQRFVSTSSK